MPQSPPAPEQIERARAIRRRFERLLLDDYDGARIVAVMNEIEQDMIAALAAEAALALEQAAQIADGHKTHRIGGICVGPEIEREVPTDGDPIAPFIPAGSGVEKLVNEMCHFTAHLIADEIRALPPLASKSPDSIIGERFTEWNGNDPVIPSSAPEKK